MLGIFGSLKRGTAAAAHAFAADPKPAVLPLSQYPPLLFCCSSLCALLLVLSCKLRLLTLLLLLCRILHLLVSAA
jgi:hypothetical protein